MELSSRIPRTVVAHTDLEPFAQEPNALPVAYCDSQLHCEQFWTFIVCANAQHTHWAGSWMFSAGMVNLQPVTGSEGWREGGMEGGREGGREGGMQ